MNTNFTSLIERSLSDNPDKKLLSISVEGSVQSFTAKELINGIATVQGALSKNAIVTQEKVVLLLPVGEQFVHAFIGTMAYGAIPVLPPSGISVLQIFGFLRKQQLKVVLTAIKVPWFVRQLACCMQLNIVVLAHGTKNDATAFEVHPVDPHQAAFITHSSGSTGAAKVIARSHQILLAQHVAIKRVFPPFAGQLDFPLFPNIVLHNLAIAVPCILPAIPKFQVVNMDAHTIIQQLIHEKVNTLTGNVFYFRKLYEVLMQQGLTILNVKALGIGGSPIPNQFAMDLRKVFPEAAIYIIYGSTEAEPISIQLVEQEVVEPEKGYAVGYFHPDITWRIVPTCVLRVNGKEVNAGEIEVQGKHVVTATDGWLQTGDIGYVDEGGKLYLTARKGNEEVYQGMQHYQAEHMLQHYLGIDRVAAVATTQGFDLYLEQALAIENSKEQLQKKIPSLVINKVIVLPKLPVDTRHYSKIRYNLLKKHAV